MNAGQTDADMFKKDIENYIKSLNKSENTKISYRRDLLQLMEFLKADKQNTVHLFLEEIKATKASTSVSRIYSSLNGYFKWAWENKIEENNLMALEIAPPVIKKEKRVPDAEAVEKIISMPKGYSAKAVRDRTMLRLIAETGMKASEIIDYRIKDADKIKLSKEGRSMLDDYMYGSRDELVRTNKKCDRLFPNCDGKPMSRQGFWKMMKSYGDITPQALRNHYLHIKHIKSEEKQH